MRFAALDGWRGIAAILVAAFHFNGLYHGFFFPVVRNSYLFVDFFFVLSGFVIAHATWGKLTSVDAAVDFAARRLWRVWPLHLAMLAAFVGLELSKAGLITFARLPANAPPFDPGGPMAASQILPHVLLTHAFGNFPRLSWNHPSWSIAAEYWTYLIFAAVTLLAGRWRTAALGVLAASSAVVLVTFAKDGMNAAQDLGVLRCLVGFVTGVFVYELRRGRKFTGAQRLEIPVLSGVLAFLMVAARGPLSFAAPFVFAVVVYVFSFEQGPVSRLLKASSVQWLGLRSYSIYMVHIFVLTLVNLAVSVLQRPLLHREVFEVMPVLGRQITGLDPFMVDGMFVTYLVMVLLLARWTYTRIETPGRRGLAGLINNDAVVRG